VTVPETSIESPADLRSRPVTAELAPRFTAVTDKMIEHARHQGALTDAEAALIEVAVYGNASLLDAASLYSAIQRAVDLGCSEQQLTTVLQLVSQLGFQGMQLGAPILLSHTGIDSNVEVRASDRPYLSDAADGTWATSVASLAGFVALDPVFSELMMESITVTWRLGALDDRMTELIYVAVDATSTHMFVSGLTSHMRKALAAGATPAQVMQVIELTTCATLAVLERNLKRVHLAKNAAS
jgi:alkylhydroperoxidase/carboxymuconolactone decarboxylase family protein YurZ